MATAPAPGPAAFAPPPEAPTAAGTRDPRILVGAAAVVVVLLLGGFLLLRPKESGGTGSLTALTGTCIRYSSDRGRLDHSVACTEPHDGIVLAYVTDQSACPPETDAILATQNDAAGSNGVLCIDEKP